MMKKVLLTALIALSACVNQPGSGPTLGSDQEALSSSSLATVTIETDWAQTGITPAQALFANNSYGTYMGSGSEAAQANVWIGGGGQSWNQAQSYNTEASCTGWSCFGANVSLGAGALAGAVQTYGTVAIGYNALNNDGSGITSTAIGYGVLADLSNSVDNTMIGYLSGNQCSGSGVVFTQNTAVGVETFTSASCGSATRNVAVGLGAMAFMQSGTTNVAIGYQAEAGTTGGYNVCVGGATCAGVSSGASNVALGYAALNGDGNATTGDNNVAIGESALYQTSSGSSNMAIGDLAMWQNTTGSYAVAIGDYAVGGSNSNYAVGIGYDALGSLTGAGGYDVGVGYNSGNGITTGEGNTVIGYNSATAIGSGNYNTVIGGNMSSVPAAGVSNNIIIGDGQGNVRIKSDSIGNLTFNGGTNVLYRCTTAGTLPIGALTINSANCGASADTGLRTN